MLLQTRAAVLALSLASIASIALGQSGGATTQQFKQTNLVADSTATAVNATTIDPNLAGAWGLSRSSAGPWWVTEGDNNVGGLSTLYNGTGVRQSLVVTIPSANPQQTPKGSPTGTVFNANAADFVLPDGKAASFLFATLDGLIVGWNGTVPNNVAQVVANRSTTSVFTGLAVASATVNGTTGTYLYAADVKSAKISVFDSSFHQATAIESAIASLGVPYGMSPFNVQNVGGNLYVTLSRTDGSTGPGQGFVAVVSPEGKLLGSLESGAFLNAPWGIAVAPSDFGQYSHDLLVGNNGDGKINVFNPITGRYIATLVDATNTPIAIDGLWALSFGNDTANGGPATSLYFAAAPGSGGLFGTLTPVQNTFGSNN